MINVYTAPEFSNEYFDAMESCFALIEDESNTVMLESAMFELGLFTDSIVNGSLSVTKEEVSLGELAHKKITERNVATRYFVLVFIVSNDQCRCYN